jgi:tetratricopeptide (TPR) repeat protein
MLTEDYILRMIGLAVAALVKALGFKKAGKYDEALQAFDQAIEHLLGFNAHLAFQLDDASLLDRLSFQGKLNVDRLLVLADIYNEQAGVYISQGKLENGQFALQRSLRLYLEALLAGELGSNLELIQKVEALRQGLPTSALPVETRLALLDYMERLLATDDSFVAAAGLSRPDLLSAFSSLQDAYF